MRQVHFCTALHSLHIQGLIKVDAVTLRAHNPHKETELHVTRKENLNILSTQTKYCCIQKETEPFK
jgi:hypothetical protein